MLLRKPSLLTLLPHKAFHLRSLGAAHEVVFVLHPWPNAWEGLLPRSQTASCPLSSGLHGVRGSSAHQGGKYVGGGPGLGTSKNAFPMCDPLSYYLSHPFIWGGPGQPPSSPPKACLTFSGAINSTACQHH